MGTTLFFCAAPPFVFFFLSKNLCGDSRPPYFQIGYGRVAGRWTRCPRAGTGHWALALGSRREQPLRLQLRLTWLLKLAQVGDSLQTVGKFKAGPFF